MEDRSSKGEPARIPESTLRLFSRPGPGLEVSLPRQGLAAWRDALTPARLLLAAALTPVLFAVYRGAIAGTPPTSLGWTALLAATAGIGALALATYLPQRGAEGGGSPCASIAGLWVLIAAMMLNAPASPATGLLALAMVSFALLQRLRGAAACGPR